MGIENLWLVEYSPTSGVFHIEKAEDCFGINRAGLSQIEDKARVGTMVKDFMAVGIAPSFEEARTIALKLEALAEETNWPNFRRWNFEDWNVGLDVDEQQEAKE